jgi:hypothetical protein
MNWVTRKIINFPSFIRRDPLRIFILIIYIVSISFIMFHWNASLPGLHVDEVNHAAFVPGILDQDAANLHHYRLPDNYFDLKDHTYRYPILGGSFYNSVVTSYLGVPFYKIFGFSISSIRYFHSIIGFLCILLGSFLILRFASLLSAYIFATIIATNPDFIFSLRSQGAIFWPVILFSLLGIYLLLLSQKVFNIKYKVSLTFLSGVCLSISMMSYFVGIFIVFPIIIYYICFYFDRPVKYFLPLLFGLVIGYSPVLYSIISVYLFNPDLLNSFGMPDFATSSNVATVSLENIRRTIALFNGGLSGFLFTKSIVGNFTSITPILRQVVFTVTVLFGFIFIFTNRKKIFAKTISICITSSIIIIYMIAGFIFKALNFHHLLPLFFILIFQISIFISCRGYLRYLFGVVAVILLVTNIAGLVHAHNTLEETGGLGYHNEVISNSYKIISTECPGCHTVFISWGLHLQFLFLSEGKQKYSFAPRLTSETLEGVLLKFKKIALVGSFSDVDKIIFDSNNIKDIKTFELKQRDGIVLYKIRILSI